MKLKPGSVVPAEAVAKLRDTLLAEAKDAWSGRGGTRARDYASHSFCKGFAADLDRLLRDNSCYERDR